MNEAEYDRFYRELIAAAEAPSHEFEKEVAYFEGCLPIERWRGAARDAAVRPR